jgi:hypothetical protein
MTGVGDEIGAHPFGAAQGRPVGQASQYKVRCKSPNDKAPWPIRGPTYSNQIDVSVAGGKDRIERQRMAYRKAQVTADYLATKQLPGGLVRSGYRAPFDDQGWILDRIENGEGESVRIHGADP